ncbi:MAG: acyl-CoA dehydrogenase family protein [Pseudomonadota bacterium]
MAATLSLAPLLDMVAQGAAEADRERTLADTTINALKGNDIMRFTASEELGGLNRSIVDTGRELEALAGSCASTAWVIWNHLCTFHLFAGLLGPHNIQFLRGITTAHEWVCFPAGASTGIKGVPAEECMTLQGKAAFGSGARYAEWAGASFVCDDAAKPLFALVNLAQDQVSIDADWQAMSLRASATDTVRYDGARVSRENVVPFPFMYREKFREPERDMIHPRYREDWVALSDMWLGLMAVGLVQACFDEVAQGIKDRVAIMGVKVAQRPTVHVNLGQAAANLQTARDTVVAACAETDTRIAARVTPTETDYLRQLAASVSALQLCDEALRRLVRVNGGNGLREGPDFERRVRDFQAMPLHINAHQDRVTEQLGRHALGLPPENPF